MASLIENLQSEFPQLEFLPEAVLAPFTAIKIGGPAEVLVTVQKSEDLLALLQHCRAHAIPATMLGWGANTLIADRGLRGLVIRNVTKSLTIHPATGAASDPTATTDSASTTNPAPESPTTTKIQARHTAVTTAHDFSALDYEESPDTEGVDLTVAGGWPLPSLIATLLAQGITGLQWYARIPATLGGAIVNNIHGGTHFISEVITSVRVLTPDNKIVTLSASDCAFGYDYSRFHTSKEVIIDAQLKLWRGDATRAQATVAEWAKRKSAQPQKSLGCVFQNISSEEQQRAGLPTPSVGYIIDQVLGLKGTRVGGAQISSQHAAFIENVENATAEDYLELTTMIMTATREKLGITLKPEIFFMGFTENELAPIHSRES